MAMKSTTLVYLLGLLAILIVAAGCIGDNQTEEIPTLPPEPPAITLVATPTLFSLENLTPLDIFEKTQYYELFTQEKLKEEGMTFPVTYDIGIVRVAPGGYTSEHKIENRSEIIYVIEGEASVSVQMVCKGLLPGDAIYIPQGIVQSVSNTGSSDLVYLSAMSPPYEEEADILISDYPAPCAKYVAPGPFVLIRDINQTASNESLASGQVYINPIMNPDNVLADTGYQLENTFSLSYVMLPPGVAMNPHSLAGTTEADYVISGTAVFTVNGTEYEVSPGDIIIIPPDQPGYAANPGTEPVEFISVCDPMWKQENEIPA